MSFVCLVTQIHNLSIGEKKTFIGLKSVKEKCFLKKNYINRLRHLLVPHRRAHQSTPCGQYLAFLLSHFYMPGNLIETDNSPIKYKSPHPICHQETILPVWKALYTCVEIRIWFLTLICEYLYWLCESAYLKGVVYRVYLRYWCTDCESVSDSVLFSAEQQ